MEKGKKKHTGTFVVHVSHCDNATWQGEVTWAEANKKKSFRSALELIRLIDGALEGGMNDERKAQHFCFQYHKCLHRQHRRSRKVRKILLLLQ